MSLITRCPACATMFKVVPDQLRISDGWVRCGHCGEVFDAAEHLQDESLPGVAAFADNESLPPSPPPAALASPGPAYGVSDGAASAAAWPVESGSMVSVPAAQQPVDTAPAELLSGSYAPPAPDPVAWQPTAWEPLAQNTEPVSTPMFAPDGGAQTGPEAGMVQDDILGIPLPAEAHPGGEDGVPTLPLPLAPAALPASGESAVDPVDEFMQEAIAALPPEPGRLSVDSLQPPPPSIEQELAAWMADRPPSTDDLQSTPVPLQTRPQELTFVRDAERRAFWRRPVVRGGLWLAGLTLFCALAAQWAVHDRDRIAAFEPRARPVLEWLCGFSGCRIAAFKQIESITIDSSSFSKTRDNLYLLNLVIKNSARVELAMPSIELTLTDTQDQPLLRRVLTPAELGAPPLVAASGEWAASLPVSVAVNGIASRVAGYRVLVFYP